MERTNNNFNLFDFDVEGFARAYGQQPQADQRSGDTVQGFEERLGALQLSSSRENSAEASSPDARPGGSGAIRGRHRWFDADATTGGERVQVHAAQR